MVCNTTLLKNREYILDMFGKKGGQSSHSGEQSDNKQSVAASSVINKQPKENHYEVMGLNSLDQTAKAIVGNNRKSKAKVIWISLGVVLLVAVAAVAYPYFSKKEQQVRQPSEDATSAKAYDLEQSGDYKSAIKKYDGLVKNSTGAKKAQYLSTQALIALRNDDFKLASEYAKQADSAGSTAETLSLLGGISLRQGDKQTAVTYYKQALEFYSKDKTGRAQLEAQELEEIIAELESEVGNEN